VNGFFANSLKGQCLTSVASGTAFPNISCHVLFYTTETTMPVTDQTAYCGNLRIPEFTSCGRGSIPYGAETNSTSGFTLNTNHYFDLPDISAWDPVTIAPFNPMYTINLYGPRFVYPNCYLRLRKRNQFENIENVNWTNATDSTWGTDWLGNLMPAGWCYSNIDVTEPLNGETYWEDARKTTDPINHVDRTATFIHANWSPFCTPVPVYDASGNSLGSYDGLTWMVFWNVGAVKNPLNPPDDALFVGPPPVPPLDPTKQLLSLEVWIYLTANPTVTNAFKSPRIAKLRYWAYTRSIGTGVEGNTPFVPYLFFNASAGRNYSVKIPINFKLLDNINNPTHITQKQAFIALSNLAFNIRA